jgi:hypothetical protein
MNDVVLSKMRRRWPKLLLALVVVGLVIALQVVGSMYLKTRSQLEELKTTQGQQKLSETDVAKVIEQLGKLTVLPDEKPIVATIIDANFLATQSAFYVGAKNGDKLVVFPKAMKAFILSPEKNLIVNSGPVLLNQQASGSAATTLPGTRK